MKKGQLIRHLTISAIALILVACGGKSNHFKIEGRILHINQSELFVYSLDGTINGLDTIKVQGGRFAYEMPCESPTTLVLVFPNLSEQPIFAEPGGKAEIKADASHLKEMEVKGTKDNELMTKYRLQIAKLSPPEILKHTEEFINNQPQSPIGAYLVRKYFIQTLNPNYSKANQLVDKMLEKQPKNGLLVQMQQQLKTLKKIEKNTPLQTFSAKDINGNNVTDASLKTGVALINVWASWNHESTTIQRQLKNLKRKYGERLKLLSVCIDADVNACKNVIERDTIRWATVCDGQMIDSPLLQKLGIMGFPDNLLIKDGRIIAHSLNEQEIQEQLEKLL